MQPMPLLGTVKRAHVLFIRWQRLTTGDELQYAELFHKHAAHL